MINVTKTFLPDKAKYQAYVDQIFASGWLTNNGHLVQQLEKRLEKYLGVQNLVLIANGTLALQVAYKVLFPEKGEVITTPFTFVATSSSLVWEGNIPIYADIEPSTLNIDPFNISKLINRKTKAILPVHVFGNSCNISDIQVLAENSGIKVIYDAAHAFGVKYNEQSILNFGDASILSFHSTKIFHTIEGGAIIFKNKNDYELAKLMINFGIPGYDQISVLGINCKMNEFQAAMGLCVLDEIDTILQGRKVVWTNYRSAFENNSNILLQQINPSCEHNYSYFPIILPSERDALIIKEALNEIDIWPRRYFYPSLESLPYLSNLQKMGISSSIAKKILCLPLYENLDYGIQNRIIDTVLKFNS
ncbi:MAG: DegT/DnrJ/EryC1/StrS family aminotransferase [Bacteroidetes bacterium]|nr:DegT/DnrJ/EryC1/StrS family aminotransferase [Bacteroidota bacterium]